MSDLKSWNPWHGCRKYSEGCEHCYMFALDRIREVPERSAVIARTQAMRKPLARDRHGNYKIPPGYCLRVNMTSDTFIEEADALMTRRYHSGAPPAQCLTSASDASTAVTARTCGSSGERKSIQSENGLTGERNEAKETGRD